MVESQVYSRAISTIDPQNAIGNYAEIWISFAKYFENLGKLEGDSGSLENANHIFSKATQVAFKTNEEKSLIITSWAEMHCRHKNIDSAIKILKYATESKNSQLNYNLRCW